MGITDKIDGEDIPYLGFLVFMVLLVVAVVLGEAFTAGDGGPATSSVEACAAIEDTEKSVACFKAIGEER